MKIPCYYCDTANERVDCGYCHIRIISNHDQLIELKKKELRLKRIELLLPLLNESDDLYTELWNELIVFDKDL